MAAAIQELPANVGAREMLTTSDAEYMARIGLGSTAKETEVKPEVKETPKVEEKGATPEPVKEAETPETNEAETPETEEVVEEIVEEEAPVVEEKPLLTKFTVADERGELEIPRNLTLSFKANGKDLEDVPLDKVVLLAQQGVYNHQRQLEMQEKEQEAEGVKQYAQTLQRQLNEYQQHFERAFDDPEFYEAARLEYLKGKTPEAKAARLEQELNQTRAQYQQENEQKEYDRVLKGSLLPTFENLLKEYPTVTQYELLGRWNELVAPMMIRGRVPVGRLGHVQRVTEHELTQWAQSEHDARSAKTRQQDKVTKEAKKVTVLAKRDIARAVAPRGTVGDSNPAPKKFKSASDWFNNKFQTGTDNED